MNSIETPDWSALPHELQYLQYYGDKYGVIQFEDRIHEYYSTISSSELHELKYAKDRYEIDGDRIEEYIRVHPITDDIVACRLYFLGVMIAEGRDRGLL